MYIPRRAYLWPYDTSCSGSVQDSLRVGKEYYIKSCEICVTPLRQTEETWQLAGSDKGWWKPHRSLFSQMQNHRKHCTSATTVGELPRSGFGCILKKGKKTHKVHNNFSFFIVVYTVCPLCSFVAMLVHHFDWGVSYWLDFHQILGRHSWSPESKAYWPSIHWLFFSL